jgi:hypothetical protein
MIYNVIFTIIGIIGLMSFIGLIVCLIVRYTHYIELKEKHGEFIADLIIKGEQNE